MPWRKIRSEDIKRGTVIRMTNMKDTPFNGAVIMGLETTQALNGDIRGYTVAHVSRPMAYAHEHFDSRKGCLISVENFEIMTDRMCAADSDIEVYESERGVVHTMMT